MLVFVTGAERNTLVTFKYKNKKLMKGRALRKHSKTINIACTTHKSPKTR